MSKILKNTIPFKQVRTSQPQVSVGIDWSNPITRGLIGVIDAPNKTTVATRTASCVPLNLAAGSMYAPKPVGNARALVRGVNPNWGTVIPNVKVCSVSEATTTSDHTIVFVGSVSHTVTTNQYLAISAQNDTTLQIAISIGDASGIGVVKGFFYTGSYSFGGSFSILDEKLHSVVLRHRNSVGQTLFLDGVADPV